MVLIILFLFGGTAKIAFLHHGNQHFGDNGKYALVPGREGYNGNSYHRILDTHFYYNVPVDIHISGTLTSSYAWFLNDNGLLERLKSHLVDIVGSVYGQNILPYAAKEINEYGFLIKKIQDDSIIKGEGWPFHPTVIWIPERVFKSKNLMPYSLVALIDSLYGKTDSYGNHIPPCILVDDNVHEWYPHNFPDGSPCYNSHKVHQMIENNHRIFVIFIQKHARDFWVWNYIPETWLYNHLQDLANSWDQEQICVYGDDWEKAAGVAGWDFGYPGAPSNSYDANIQWAKNTSWIQPIHVAEAAKWWGVDRIYDSDPYNDPPTIYINYSAYQELHSWTGGNYDNWYYDFKNTKAYGTGTNAPDLNLNGINGDYEDLWLFSWNNLKNSPDNKLKLLGFLTLNSLLYETAWHTGPGGELIYWGKNLWNHTGKANIFSYASNWLTSPKFVFRDSLDIDGDGFMEFVIGTDYFLSVFEKRGGKIIFLCDSSGTVYIGNFFTNWGGEGDFSDYSHSGFGEDAWHENDLYNIMGFYSDTASAFITFENQGMIKTYSFKKNQKFIKLNYNSPFIIFSKSVLSPDLYKIIFNYYSLNFENDISPNGWMYAGFRNLKSGKGAFILWKSGVGLKFNLISKVPAGEKLEIGGISGNFDIYFYAGSGVPDLPFPGPGDLEGPLLYNLSRIPLYNITDSDSVKVKISAQDPSGVDSVFLYWTNNNWNSIFKTLMKLDTLNIYKGMIPPHPSGTKVIYTIYSRDSLSNISWLGKNDSFIVGKLNFLMDGILDPGVPLIAENPEMHLWGVYDKDSGRLYIATESAGNSPDRFSNDHFIFISFNPYKKLVKSPWNKTDSLSFYNFFLADENDNEFVSFFDSLENIINDTVNFKFFSSNSDTGILEGIIYLRNLYGFDPESLYLAVGTYKTYDGGSLEWQVPRPRILNKRIEPEEFVLLKKLKIKEEIKNKKISFLLKTINPDYLTNPYNKTFNLKIYDLSGRRIFERKILKGKTYLPLKRNGIFFIRIEDENKKVLNFKIIKIK
ncbi:MAG: T9SS type A sorting domain-containing protein [candidate division WOR-3 bacterium]